MAMINEEQRPQPQIVADFHTNSDVDASKDSQHHTIGLNEFQAAAGSHTHNGSDSYQLLTNEEIVGSRGGNTALASVIGILERMGAKNSTTP
jgi:hypothetical protein